MAVSSSARYQRAAGLIFGCFLNVTCWIYIWHDVDGFIQQVNSSYTDQSPLVELWMRRSCSGAPSIEKVLEEGGHPSEAPYFRRLKLFENEIQYHNVPKKYEMSTAECSSHKLFFEFPEFRHFTSHWQRSIYIYIYKSDLFCIVPVKCLPEHPPKQQGTPLFHVYTDA